MVQSTNMQMPMQQIPQQGSGANAVAINIYNPQAYGSAQGAQQQPYAIQQPIYNVPYASMYQQEMVPNQYQQGAYQQFMPVANVMNAPVQSAETQYVAPAPQTMPESVISNGAAQVQQQEVAQETKPVEIVDSKQAAQTVDIDALVQNLKSTDNNVKSEAINQIAAYAQEAPEVALQVVSEPIMQSLVDVINEDTTALEGPTPEQIAVAEKIAKGEQLTPEEDALAEQLSPRDMANKNRIFALYTLAMVQKLQRDELNQYIESQKANGQEPIAPLNVQDLVGYNDVINVIQKDARPEVQVAAIQALQHVVEPQDKATVEPILTEAQKSADEAVKTAATEALAKFTASEAPAQPAA